MVYSLSRPSSHIGATRISGISSHVLLATPRGSLVLSFFPAVVPAVIHASTLRFGLFYMGPGAHTLSIIASPVKLRMWGTASLAAVVPACTSVRPGTYGNASVSTCAAFATGLLGFLWLNTSTPQAPQ